ncbi:hypothetical protein K432DRAFT_294382 [Lepidopterella palustris CBS 459.81]|uniref:Heterokaryon incompatibility domain-containing protein n=1 Tax=Lepidopterella palustris CBS 459.81 TaxID=1314670 RepID=A0A8E2EDU8_9PEZI|nr:hypothetical protein K432DRAFT_294382 [Lepidopterella palustris CBS 459.81]
MSTKITPLNKVLYWTWSSTQHGSKAFRVFDQNPYLDVALKWIPSCTVMLLLFCFPQNIGGETRNNGFYDPVRDRDRHYSKKARNPCEDNPRGERASQRVRQIMDSQDRYWGITRRPLRPRTLCFLKESSGPPEAPEQSFTVRRGDDNNEEYVFISYTRREFCVEIEINRDWAARDRRDLLRFAVAATRAAKVPAFWIDFKCVATDKANIDGTGSLSEDTNDIYEDVYRICDVLRGAHSMAAIVGPPCDRKNAEEQDRQNWLSLWASRMWVLPEILLAPGEHGVWIYIQASGDAPENIVPDKVAKRNLAEFLGSDVEDIRQLIEHYEGSIQLSQLELVQLALDCLRRRTTVERTNADLAYALKGLLRRRPQIMEKESGFEAFASLSLANDSQRLLERLICMLPPDPDADWSDMRDAWEMQLWDIEPTCQIAGIVDDRTVLLDGAYGAAIQWSRLETVAFIKRDTAFRTMGRVAIRGSPIYFTIGVIFVATSSGISTKSSNPLLIIGAIVLAVSLLIILAAPYMLFKIYLGKFWSTQAWFFGIEGAVDDLGRIERSLFGFNENRLTWSTNGSLLSRHLVNDFKECQANPPEKNNIRDMLGSANPVPQANHPGQRQQKIFTLIDTYSMTATMFYAYHPPTTVLICGQEGGMQRAVLCSYDWKTQTYCRETVLRMKTLVLERMFRVDRFRFALRRH